MEYVKKRLSELKPYENNPRINDEAVDDVAESIRQCSYIAPIIVDEDGVILAGHTRYKALKKLGYQECEVVVASDLTKRRRKSTGCMTIRRQRWLPGIRRSFPRNCMMWISRDMTSASRRQPSQMGEESGEAGPKIMTCPCCGEVFEV